MSYLLAEQRRTTDRWETTTGGQDPSLPDEATTTRRNVKEYYRWEVGYVLSAGYQLTTRLGLELRYAAGLTQLYRPRDYKPTLIWDPSLIRLSPVARARNSSVQVQASYQFSAL